MARPSGALVLEILRGDTSVAEATRNMGPLTVFDVQRSGTDADEHTRVVTAWAQTTWAAWAPHHAQIRQWAAPEHTR